MMQIPVRYLRLSGWALLIGGLMGFTGQLIHLDDVPASFAEVSSYVSAAMNNHILLAWASIFILLGLPAIFLRQAMQLKWWGWLSFPLLFISLVLEIFHGPVQILAYPIMFSYVKSPEDLHVLSQKIMNLSVDLYPQQLLVLIPIVPFLFGGLILLGLATLKAKTFPKALAIFVYVVVGIGILSFAIPIKLKFFEVSFAYFHLLFLSFGATLAFNKRISSDAEILKAA